MARHVKYLINIKYTCVSSEYSTEFCTSLDNLTFSAHMHVMSVLQDGHNIVAAVEFETV